MARPLLYKGMVFRDATVIWRIEAMKVYYTKCRSCGGSMRESAKRCIHCGASKRPLPAFWFTFMSALFVTYVILDNYNLI